MDITLAKYELPMKGIAVFLIDESLTITGLLATINNTNYITRVLKASKSFKGKKGQTLRIVSPEGSNLDAIILHGIGIKSELNELHIQSIGGKIAIALNSIEVESATVIVEQSETSEISTDQFASNLSIGLKLRSYRFNKYFVDKKKDHEIFLRQISLAGNFSKNNEYLNDIESITSGVFFSRDLVSMPANVLYPESFAAECKKLSKIGLKVTILNEKDMTKLGMHSLLGVGRGSEKESQLVILEWYGSKKGKKDKPVAFIGKGVTFDTGGISIKPAAGMADMKYDMAGAGAVAGLMKSLALRKANVNAVGVLGLVENMPSGSAQRPGDVVVSMSGQTIEVDNTDAEGRLVLADALWYTQLKFKPKFMINLATLTGAIVVALGEGYYAGLFSNDDDLAKKLIEAGKLSGENLWRMPLAEHYDKQINSEIADIKNVGNGKGGGSITAAQFLQRFVNKCPWAHLDIAGMAWDKQGSDLVNKGATGFGVRLLNRLVAKYFESK